VVIELAKLISAACSPCCVIFSPLALPHRPANDLARKSAQQRNRQQSECSQTITDALSVFYYSLDDCCGWIIELTETTLLSVHTAAAHPTPRRQTVEPDYRLSAICVLLLVLPLPLLLYWPLLCRHGVWIRRVRQQAADARSDGQVRALPQ